MLERSEGGRGSGSVAAAALALLPRDDAWAWRAGVLGMPGRCSQEKGTAEERSGERKRWWNGEGAGEKDGKEKERPEDDDDEEVEDADAEAGTVELEDADGDDDDGRSCRRRRRHRVAAVGAAGAGGGEEEEGLGIAAGAVCCLVVWSEQSGGETARVRGGVEEERRRCGAALGFYGWAMAR